MYTSRSRPAKQRLSLRHRRAVSVSPQDTRQTQNNRQRTQVKAQQDAKTEHLPVKKGTGWYV